MFRICTQCPSGSYSKYGSKLFKKMYKLNQLYSSYKSVSPKFHLVHKVAYVVAQYGGQIHPFSLLPTQVLQQTVIRHCPSCPLRWRIALLAIFENAPVRYIFKSPIPKVVNLASRKRRTYSKLSKNHRDLN